MGLMEEASSLVDRGMATARDAFSDVALERLGFMAEFCRLCDDGWSLGFHEANGGNASLRLTDEEKAKAQPFLVRDGRPWVALDPPVPALAGEQILVTAAGCFLKNVSKDPSRHCGIVEVDEEGSAWRILWGFRDGARPTSELGAHLLAQAARKRATGGASRVLYHAHPTQLIALTAIEPWDAERITQVLWRSLTEGIIAFPEGLGYLEWMVPGSRDLAKHTAIALESHRGCIWQLHGLFASGCTGDEALGLVHTANKAASVYLEAATVLQGTKPIPNLLKNEDLLAIADTYDLPVDRSTL